MNRPVHKASDCAREGISRDALAHQQLTYEPLDMGNLERIPEFLPPGAQSPFLPQRTPLPLRPGFPLVADGIAAQFPAAPRPSEIEYHIDLGDLTSAMAFSRLKSVLRGGHACELVDSSMASFMKAPPCPFIGTFRGSWRPSIKWFGLVGRSVDGLAPRMVSLRGCLGLVGRSEKWSPCRGKVPFTLGSPKLSILIILGIAGSRISAT